MIIVKNRTLMFSDREQYIGTPYDNNSMVRAFSVKRLTIDGIDIAHLSFHLNIQRLDGSKDTDYLEKQITDDKIILTWMINGDMLGDPGTAFISLRGHDATGTVKWSTYLAPVYVGNTIGLPDLSEAQLTELERLEVKFDILNETEILRELAEEERARAEIERQDGELARKEAEKLRIEAENARIETAKTATQNANNAADTANTAAAEADTAKKNAEAAAETANTSASNANTQATKATNAAETANTAASRAEAAAEAANNSTRAANDAANEARTAAQNAQNATQAANDAAERANGEASKVEGAISAANDAAEAANLAASNVDNATTKANNAASNANIQAEFARNAASDAGGAALEANAAAARAETATANANAAAESANAAAAVANSVPERVANLEKQTETLNNDLDEIGVFVTPQMFGAKADGVTDDTEAIQNALNESDFVYIPDGTYMINASYSGYGYESNGGIKPKSDQIIIMSKNATLKALASPTSFYNIINLFQVDNVTIIGGKVEGDREYHVGTDGEHGHGIAIRACNNITIDGVESFDCWGDSVDVGYGGIANCNNVKIYNCKLHDSRRQGISITGANGVVVRDCEIYNINGTMPQSGIDIEPDGDIGIAENITIDSCNFYNNDGGDIIIAEVTNNIQSVKITNCTTDTKILCLSGKDVSIDSSTIGEIQISADFTKVSNSAINALLLSSGNAIFNNCEFTDDTVKRIITSNLDKYPTRVTEFLEFHGCYFKTSSNSDYFMYMQGKSALIDDIPLEYLFKFVECRFELCGSCIISNRLPQKTMFDGCEVIFETAPYELFQVKNTWNTKLEVRDTNFLWNGDVSYLLGFASFDGYDVEIYNSKFANSKNLVYCSSSGNSGGKIKMFNNIVSNENIYNANKFEMILANDISDFLTGIPSEYVTETDLANKKYLTSVPSEYVTETELANKKYLTLNDLPLYNGGVS